MKTEFSLKYYKTKLVIILILAISSIYGAFTPIIYSFLQEYDIVWIFFPSSTIIIGLSFSLLNSQLHKIPFLWNLIIKVPYISGQYNGKVYWWINEVESFKNCSMRIYQTTSMIKIDCEFWNTDEEGNKIISSETYSESIVEDFFENEKGQFVLHFSYIQKGSYDSKIPPREGYNVLTLNKDISELKGYYFAKNSFSDGNGGKIVVKLID